MLGSTYVRLLEIFSNVTVLKIIENSSYSTKLLQKQKYAVFSRHSVYTLHRQYS